MFELYKGQDPFVYHAPSLEMVGRIETFRAWCGHLYEIMLEEIPESPERTLAIRKLEEVSMWGNKAIVFYPEEVSDAR